MAATAGAALIVAITRLQGGRGQTPDVASRIVVVDGPARQVGGTSTARQPVQVSSHDPTDGDTNVIRRAEDAVLERLKPAAVTAFSGEAVRDRKRSLVCGDATVGAGAQAREAAFISFPFAAIAYLDDGSPAFRELYKSLCSQ